MKSPMLKLYKGFLYEFYNCLPNDRTQNCIEIYDCTRLNSLKNLFMFYNIYIVHKYIMYLTKNKTNLFVLSGHGSESFAAFLNEVILQKKHAAVITAAVITTHHESELRFR